MKYYKIYFLTFFSIVIFGLRGYTQNFGYLGKKNMVEGGIYGCFPAISNTQEFYKVGLSGKLKKRIDLIDLTFGLNYTRNLTKQLSLELQYGFQRADLPASLDYLDRLYKSSETVVDLRINYNSKCENLKMNYNYVIPRIEIKNPNSIFGVGIYHAVGFGFGKLKVHGKQYKYSGVRFDIYGLHDDIADSVIQATEIPPMANLNYIYKTLILDYTIGIRKPITEKIFINYGLRLYASGLTNTLNKNEGGKYLLSEANVRTIIGSSITTNFVQFKFNLSYVF